MITRCTFVCVVLSLLFTPVRAEGPRKLIDAGKPHGGWRFDNGREFPGAKGKLELSEDDQRGTVLNLSSDFTGGGQYVQAAIDLPKEPIDTLSFWVHVPAGTDSLTTRLVDGSGQCHQLKLKLSDKGGWQQVTFPVERYFQAMGTPAALDLTRQYEKWSGANDGKWHQPGRLFVVLLTRSQGQQGQTLLSDVTFRPGRPKAALKQTISLTSSLAAGEIDWHLNMGQEFKGAKGGLDLVKDQPQSGQNAMRLHGDFTNGGAYVGVNKSLADYDIQSLAALRLTMRSEKTNRYNVLLVDGSGQTHQRKGIAFEADGKWHDVKIEPSKIAGGEHWGGANDGKWHQPVRFFQVMLNTGSAEDKQPDLTIANIEADVVLEAQVAPPAFTENFEAAERFDRGWKTAGQVTRTDGGAQQSQHALTLNRTLQTIETKTAATGAPFAVTPGSWQVNCSWQADLHSPDNSYHGSVALQVLSRTGDVLETIPVGIGFGKQEWQQVSRTVTLPRQAAQARFQIQLNKTYGRFTVDELSASRLTVQPIQQRVERILLSSDALGNLFLPNEALAFKVTVEASSPLPPQDQVLHYSVRDYWGAGQLPTAETPLSKQSSKNGQFRYTATFTLPSDPLEVGKYYELHAFVPQDPGDPVGEYTGLAILPPAVAKKHRPEQIPFTIRNWDNRVVPYYHLSDRLGLRLIGLWGGWSSRAPYQEHLPGVDVIQQLGARWLTTTPASDVEHNGFKNYSEESLRKGMHNFLQTYADKGLYMIAQGNEPHGTGQKVLDNVRAYRAIYEAVKDFDPQIQVLGTSVEPNEEYFKAGYQNYLDAYDFHIYEHYTKVRDTMVEYRALMKKYNAVKPIHSTELGLNSQGQTRLAVAREMIKKCTVFFAEGGATVSWFTIQYPDPQGKARGQFGDSHCVFDCKYSLYNPRLDAVTYYHLINGIAVKKFVEERQYNGGAQAYLFRDTDGHALQVLWSDEQRQDVQVPLPAGQRVQLVRIDGSRQELEAAAGGVTLTLSADPVLLFYDSPEGKLADQLAAPALVLAGVPPQVTPGTSLRFRVSAKGLTSDELQVRAPAAWQVTKRTSEAGSIEVALEIPANSTAREARAYVQRVQGNKVRGEVTVEAVLDAAR